MSNRQFSKYASANIGFEIDHTLYLSNANNGAPDTLATSVWQASSSDIIIVSSAITGNKAQVRISGGIGGNIYKLENKFTLTSSGYADVDYIEIRVLSDPVNP